MGLLSRQAIRKRIDSGDLVITPTPDEADYDSDAVEVHLGAKVYQWKKQAANTTLSIQLLETAQGEFKYTEFQKDNLREVAPDDHGVVTLRPQSFYLADLKQETKLPPDLAMHINGKSSLARLGVLIHLTAPHAHAGWSGTLALEIYNLGPFNIELKEGMKIGQLTFWKIDDPEERQSLPTGQQFDNQVSARGLPR